MSGVAGPFLRFSRPERSRTAAYWSGVETARRHGIRCLISVLGSGAGGDRAPGPCHRNQRASSRDLIPETDGLMALNGQRLRNRGGKWCRWPTGTTSSL